MLVRATVGLLVEQMPAQRLEPWMMRGADCQQVRVVEPSSALGERDEMMNVEDGRALAADQAGNSATMTVTSEGALASLAPAGSVVDS